MPAELVFEGGGRQLIVAVEDLRGIRFRPGVSDGSARLLITLKDDVAARFGDMTEALVGQTLALTVCGEVVAQPRVMVPIADGALVIHGSDETLAELTDMLSEDRPCP